MGGANIEALSLTDFWRRYWPVLGGFMAFQIITQTDLVMIAPLGVSATAAFIVPIRLMFLDAIVAYALGPVFAILLAEKPTREGRTEVMRSAYSLTLVISVVVAVASLPLYELIVKQFVASPTVRALSSQALYWMTLTIPVRMLVFVASMCLFSAGEGKRVSYVYVGTISLNALLDWFLSITCASDLSERTCPPR